MRMGGSIEGMGLGKRRAKLHTHNIITLAHSLINHKKEGGGEYQIS